MKRCPIDDSELIAMDRQEIEIDFCPTCRGVWLDRGELDKLIERSVGLAPVPVAASPVVDDDDDTDDDLDEDVHRSNGRSKRRRRSLLGELFDFGEDR